MKGFEKPLISENILKKKNMDTKIYVNMMHRSTRYR
jgi:hypothetical protein